MGRSGKRMLRSRASRRSYQMPRLNSGSWIKHYTRAVQTKNRIWWGYGRVKMRSRNWILNSRRRRESGPESPRRMRTIRGAQLRLRMILRNYSSNANRITKRLTSKLVDSVWRFRSRKRRVLQRMRKFLNCEVKSAFWNKICRANYEILKQWAASSKSTQRSLLGSTERSVSWQSERRSSRTTRTSWGLSGRSAGRCRSRIRGASASSLRIGKRSQGHIALVSWIIKDKLRLWGRKSRIGRKRQKGSTRRSVTWSEKSPNLKIVSLRQAQSPNLFARPYLVSNQPKNLWRPSIAPQSMIWIPNLQHWGKRNRKRHSHCGKTTQPWN